MEALRFAILGLGAGAVYGLTGQGIVLTYRGSGVVNFAHGAVGMVGAFIFYVLRDNAIGAPVALLIAALFGAVVGAVIQLLLMRPLRSAPALSRLIVTLGLFVVLLSIGQQLWGQRPRIVAKLLPVSPVALFPTVTVGADRLIILGVGLAVAVVLGVVSGRTRFGLATAAVAENRRVASMLGISPDVVAAVSWALGGVLAVVGAILIVNLTGLQVQGLALLVVPALAAALVGGFRSYVLTFVGGLLIGVLESEIAYVQLRVGPDVSLDGWARSVPFLVIIVVLVARGRSLPMRGETSERPPALGSGGVRLRSVIPLVAAALLLASMASASWAEAITTTAGVAMVTLSVVVVTGYAGQVSLAQFALAGIGAWIAARLVAVHDVPFELAFLAGVAGTIPIGLLVGLPALRTRGVNLAVATLGLALLLESQILANPARTGGIAGTHVGTPTLFGVELDSVAHPSRYAAVCVSVVALAAVVVANLRKSRTGRRLVAVRTNERAAAALGISVYGSKLYAFGLGAALAAVGGILIAFRRPTVVFSPTFDSFGSIFVVVDAVTGGVGSAVGGLLGAILAPGAIGAELFELLGDDLQHLFTLIGGLLLILILVRDPNGLVSLARRTKRAAGGRLGVRSRSTPPTVLPEAGSCPRAAQATLDVADISVRHGGVMALSNVSLTVRSGEIVGVIGPNGAGKTTLIDAATGFAPISAGRVELNGRDISRMSALRRTRAGVGRTFQTLELFDTLTVAENIQSACDSRTLWSYCRDPFRPDDGRLTATAVAAVHDVGLVDYLDKRPPELSSGQRRLVAIARAIAAGPSVLLLDEPAAGLDVDERDLLGRLLERLAKEWGLAVLVIEHDVSLVLATCDRVAVLERGHKIAEGSPQHIIQRTDLAESLVAIASDPAAHESQSATLLPDEATPRPTDGHVVPVVEARRLTAGYSNLPVIRDVDLHVDAGEVVALLGANGAGKTTTLLALVGELEPIGGHVAWSGQARRLPLDGRARWGMALVPEERATFDSLSASANLRLGRGSVSDALHYFPELSPLLERRAGLLSSGEQRVLALARALASRPRVLIVDELSLGLAPSLVERLMISIRAAADRGVAVLLVEQHISAALQVADRCYVLHRGRIVMHQTSAHPDAAERVKHAWMFGANPPP